MQGDMALMRGSFKQLEGLQETAAGLACMQPVVAVGSRGM
jgi:hypothetical protein